MKHKPSLRDAVLRQIANLIAPPDQVKPTSFAPVTAQVDDSSGWVSYTSRPHERDYSEIQSLYEDALVAYRKNPLPGESSQPLPTIF